MAMPMGVTGIMRMGVIMRMCVIMGVCMLSGRSYVRMDDVYPWFAQMALERVGPRFVPIRTVLTRLLILFCPREVNDPAHW